MTTRKSKVAPMGPVGGPVLDELHVWPMGVKPATPHEPITDVAIRLVAEGAPMGSQREWFAADLVGVEQDAAWLAIRAERARLREAVEGLPAHSIGGYEWECDDCHYHYHPGKKCAVCSETATREGYIDSAGNLSQHRHLVDPALVLALLGDKR